MVAEASHALVRWLLRAGTRCEWRCSGAFCARGRNGRSAWVVYCSHPREPHARVVAWRDGRPVYASFLRARVRWVHRLARAAFGVQHVLAPTDQRLAREWIAQDHVNVRAWLDYQTLAAQSAQSKLDPETPSAPAHTPELSVHTAPPTA